MQFDIAQALLDVLIFWILTTPHEFAHAWVADRLGDDTPRLEGRVTLNPLAHIDLMGTVIVPLACSLLGGVFFGWGRSVNCNPSRLRGGYGGLTKVALAGPVSNVIFAVVLAGVYALWPAGGDVLYRAAYISLFLAVFNLLPVPPLDGSKFLLVAGISASAYYQLSQYGFLVLLVVMQVTNLGHWLSTLSSTGAVVLFNTLGGRG